MLLQRAYRFRRWRMLLNRLRAVKNALPPSYFVLPTPLRDLLETACYLTHARQAIERAAHPLSAPSLRTLSSHPLHRLFTSSLSSLTALGSRLASQASRHD